MPNRYSQNLKKTSEQHQLNHYFKDGTLDTLLHSFAPYLTPEQIKQLQQISKTATSINVRSRQKNDTVLLIIKGSLDAASAAHSHQRMEFEAPLEMTLEQLDQVILAAGWQIEAKWQADRVMYDADGITTDMMFTPGYGYVAEFEKVVTNEDEREAAHAAVIAIMQQLGVKELPNDRLERMFAYYNQHWQNYYGTTKTFTVE